MAIGAFILGRQRDNQVAVPTQLGVSDWKAMVTHQTRRGITQADGCCSLTVRISSEA